MVAAILAIVMALISYFTAKKSGAEDSTALAAGAAAGLGTYYVATQTDWGKSVVANIDEAWTSLTGPNGPELDEDGSPIAGPPGATVKRDANGDVVRDNKGNPVLELGGKLISSAGEVLQSWGPTGTAAVIATGAVASDDSLRKWLPFIGIGAVALLILR